MVDRTDKDVHKMIDGTDPLDEEGNHKLVAAVVVAHMDHSMDECNHNDNRDQSVAVGHVPVVMVDRDVPVVMVDRDVLGEAGEQVQHTADNHKGKDTHRDRIVLSLELKYIYLIQVWIAHH